MKLTYFVLLLTTMLVTDVYGKTCTPKDAEAADAAIDTLDSWTKVAQSVKRFSHCDDGSIAEGYSEAVARLLVDKWDTMPELATLIKHNSALKPFVLRHIDSTLDTNDLNQIKKLAVSSCPTKEFASLCKDINRAAKKAGK